MRPALALGVALVAFSAGAADCVPASGVEWGCLTTDAQTIEGEKTFGRVVRMPQASVDLIGPRSVGGQVRLTGERAVSDPNSPAVSVENYWNRDAGAIQLAVFRSQSGTPVVLAVDNTGNLFLMGDNGNGGALHFNNSSSGATHVRGPSGLYGNIRSRLPEGYWGQHGGWTFGNETPMIAGFPFSVRNTIGPPGAWDKFMVNYAGAISWPSGTTYAQLPPCDGTTDHPVNDGGPGYYVALDAGQAHHGATMFVDDVGRLCFCNQRGYLDGGPRSGWRRVKDEQGCDSP